jgi:hypothetical protein
MNKNSAIKLARYHKFTKFELYNMLVEALDSESDEYWTKANHVNRIFDNGYYFNWCKKLIGYNEHTNKEALEQEPIVVRVLEGFGKYSKVQIPKKIKPDIKIQGSEKPTLDY